MKLFGSLSAISFSPIVTIEPRRRKFHCPIKLRIPLPAGYRLDTSGNLRLLCSIQGGQSRAVWEDVTGSTPLSIHDKCLLFTTTVSARFWLVHCQRSQRCQDAARFAQELWRYLIQVPFMAKFVVFAKRRDINEAQVRVFCMTDDKEEKTLEVQEHYTLVARSRDVEVLEGQMLYLEFGGNLIPAHLNGARTRSGWSGGGGNGLARGPGGRPNSGLLVANSSVLLNEQLAFAFRAFQENRLAFACRLREVGQEPSGRIAFMEDSLKYLASLNAQQRAYLSERRRRAVCTLGIQLPAMCVHYDNILGTPKRNSYYATAMIGDLSLADIASELNLRPVPVQQISSRPLSPEATTTQIYVSGSDLSTGFGLGASHRPDWMRLAPRLGIPRDEVEFIAEHCGGSASGQGVTPALLLLMHWYRLASPDDRDQDLARGLQAIGRDDIARKLNFPIEPKRISRSTAELLREIEQIPVRSTENLYGGSELSSAYGQRNQRATSSARAASSLRRLNDLTSQRMDDANEQDGSGGGQFERQRRRAGSTSSIQKQQSGGESSARNNYFSSGLRQAGRLNDDDDDSRVIEPVPAIEVSQATGRRRESSLEEVSRMERNSSDQTESTEQPATSGGNRQNQTTVSTMPPLEMVNNVSASTGVRRQHLEQLAQNLVETVIEDALEHYLRRELQQAAEETVREALAAAGAGRTDKHGAKQSQERAEEGADDGVMESDDDDGEDDDEDELERTLVHELGAGKRVRQEDDSQRDRLRASYSMSPPSRLDADDIFQDLGEMSNFADRIDSILEQTVSEHSTRSGRMRSVSPMPQMVFEQDDEVD